MPSVMSNSFGSLLVVALMACLSAKSADGFVVSQWSQRQYSQQQGSTASLPPFSTSTSSSSSSCLSCPSRSRSVRLNHGMMYSPFSTVASASSSSSSSRLYHSPEVEAVVMVESSSSAVSLLVDSLTSDPALWSSAIMLCIVGLLYVWEESVAIARERLPPTLMPVVDSMLAEMGGLGFIGLFLGGVVVDGPVGHVVEHLSEEYLGDGEILLETFEFLHEAFFETAIAFFLVAGLTVFRILKQVDRLEEVSTACFDASGDGEISLTELAEFLKVETTAVDLNSDGIVDEEEIEQAMRSVKRPSLIQEAFMTTDRIRAEALVVRERFIETFRVGKDFKIEKYFIRVFGDNLEKIVELSPLTWLPLIPALSLGRSVDMSRDVVSAASENANLSCGFFLASPAFFWVSTSFVVLAAMWGYWNFYKMVEIKEMLVPVLVKDACRTTGEIGEATLLPPRYENIELVEKFEAGISPGPIGWIESFYAKPPRNRQERLFGVAGAAGPALYRNSIKFHTWLVVSQIVFWGYQIVARDLQALYFGWEEVGNPDLLVPELAIFSFYVALATAQLVLAPQTFLCFCLVTTIEELIIKKWICLDDVVPMKMDEERLTDSDDGNDSFDSMKPVDI